MVVFENNHFLVIEKRAGWLAIADRMGSPSEREHWEKSRAERLWVVHRLDREVSGLMLFARNEAAHRAANDWFEKRVIEKTYEAFCVSSAGSLPEKEQRWESRLLRGKKRAYEKPFGKPAVTLARFDRTYDQHGKKLELWTLKPLTGRAHQLRYEMAKHQRPVWGDELYGSKEKFPFEGAIGLRAVSLSFAKIKDREKWELPDELKNLSLVEWLTSRC